MVYGPTLNSPTWGAVFAFTLNPKAGGATDTIGSTGFVIEVSDRSTLRTSR
jgi:hypothetical protein